MDVVYSLHPPLVSVTYFLIKWSPACIIIVTKNSDLMHLVLKVLLIFIGRLTGVMHIFIQHDMVCFSKNACITYVHIV